jgi:integrase
LIPLSKDAAVEVERYLEDRRRPGFPTGVDSPLLLHRHGRRLTAYSGNGLSVLMQHLFRIAGVRTAAGRLPRVHDLRFTFAFHACCAGTVSPSCNSSRPAASFRCSLGWDFRSSLSQNLR